MTIRDLKNTISTIGTIETTKLNKATMMVAFGFCFLATKCGKKM